MQIVEQFVCLAKCLFMPGQAQHTIRGESLGFARTLTSTFPCVASAIGTQSIGVIEFRFIQSLMQAAIYNGRHRELKCSAVRSLSHHFADTDCLIVM